MENPNLNWKRIQNLRETSKQAVWWRLQADVVKGGRGGSSNWTEKEGNPNLITENKNIKVQLLTSLGSRCPG